MWIFTPEGFYSIVMRKGLRHKLGRTHQVRARVREDLNAFVDFIDGDPNRYPIIETPKADYRYRIMVSRRDLNKWWNLNMDELNYTNFKTEAGKVLGHERVMDLHDIWQIMADRQPGGAYGWHDRKPVDTPAVKYTDRHTNPRNLLDELDDYDDWEAQNRAYNVARNQAFDNAVENDDKRYRATWAKSAHEMTEQEWIEYQEQNGY